MIELPAWAVPNGAEPFLIDFGGITEPALGSEEQRIDRMGNRFGIAVTFPPFETRQQGRIIVSRLIRAKTEGLRIEYPLLDFDPGVPGAIAVDGGGQAGRSLIVRGATPHYAFREGQPFSIERADGRHYLQFLDAEIVADAAGEAALPISPMLRDEFLDGAACHFAKPMIEGFVRGDEWRWKLSVERLVSVEFELREVA